MPRVCYLHLGMNKAGSTALQQAFYGFRGPKTEYLELGGPNQSRQILMRFAKGVPPAYYASGDPEKQAEERVAASRELDAAIDAAAGKNIILSSEYLSNFRDPGRCQSVIDYLSDRFDQVHGIMYVREPFSFMASSIQQAMKGYSPRRDFDGYYPDYLKRFGPWRKAVRGKGKIQFVLFDRSAFAGGDLLHDFASRTGVDGDWIETHRAGKTVNESLSAEGTAVLARYRRAYGPTEPRGPRRSVAHRISADMSDFGTHRFAIDREIMAPFFAAQAEDIAFAERCMGRPFPAPKEHGNEKRFGNFDDLYAYGGEIAPQFAAWLAETYPRAPVRGDTPEDMLRNVEDHMVAQWSRVGGSALFTLARKISRSVRTLRK